MAHHLPKAALRGFLVHEAKVDLEHLAPATGLATSSTYTELDGQPGSPVPGDPRSAFLPHVHNAQRVDIDLLTTRGGVPRRGGLPGVDGAAIVYRETGQSNDEYRGWNEPNLVQGYRPVEWSTADVTWTQVTSVTIPSTQQVIAVGLRASVTAKSWSRDPVARTWSPDVAISSTVYDLACCFLLSRTSRVVALLATSGGVIDAFYTDDGTSWSEYATQLTSTLISAATDQMEAVEDRNGNVLMIGVDPFSGNYEQWVSSDAGVTFIRQGTGTNWATQFRIVRLADGRILVVYIADTADNEAEYIILDDAYDLIAGKLGTQLDGTTTVDSIAAVVDADGIVYVYLQAEAFTVDSAQAKVARSIDDAASFDLYSANAIYTSRGAGLSGVNQDLTHHLLSASATGGEIVLLATPEYDPASSPPTTDGSLVSITLGGWCSDEQPGLPFQGRMARNSWAPTGSADGSVWLPTQTLAYQNWDDTLSGGPLEVDPIPGGYHRFTTVAAQSWAQYGDNSYQPCATFFGEFTVNGGSSATGDHGRLRVSHCDGVNEAGVRIGAVSDEFRVRDFATNALLASAVVQDMVDDLVQFLVVFTALAEASVYYKLTSSSLWIAVVEGAALTTQANANIGNEIRVGTVDSAVTAVVNVGTVALLWAPSTNGMFLRGSTTTADRSRLVWGKAVGPAPYPVRDQVGDYSDAPMMHLSASGGSARERESFSVPAVFAHQLANILPQVDPSPSVYWSSADNGEQVLTWDLGADSRVGHSWAVGLALYRTNFRTAVLEVRTDAGVTSTLGTYDAIVGETLSFVRSGDLLEPASTGNAAATFWARGAWKDGFVILPGAVARRILWNEGGGWQPGPGVKPVIRIELLGGEPTSGTMDVIARSGVLVAHRTAPTAYRYIRVRIPTQTKVSAACEIGQLILGGLLIPGRQWSRGWSWRYTTNTRIEEDDYGTMWPDQRGPVRRELTVSWQDPQDASALRRGPDVPYLGASAGTPGLAAGDDVWFQIAGLLGETEGGSLPVVAVADVPRITSTITDPSLILYGLLQARPQFNNVQGDEGRSEVSRGESITVREQV